MTLRINLEEIRARVQARRQQRADRDAALRDRGVAVLPTCTTPVHRRKGWARVLPWRRRDD